MRAPSLLLALVVLLAGEARAADATFVVICHPGVAAESIDRSTLSRIFLRKTTVWPDGSTARPVDLPTADPVREAFTLDVHKRAIVAVRNYWNQQLFAGGSTPPPERPDTRTVVEFVKSTPGAVGYVAAKDVGAGVKVLAVLP